MINPYQAPPEGNEAASHLEGHSAEFQLTGRQIRFAESKFLLLRCGGRLTIASIIMIGLAVGAAVDIPGLPPVGNSNSFFQLSLIGRELVVMGIATAVYLWLVRDARRAVRSELERNGISDGAVVTVTVDDVAFRWTTPKGSFAVPAPQTWLITTGKGSIVRLEKNLFVFIPKQAAFATGQYRDFMRALQNAQVGLPTD